MICRAAVAVAFVIGCGGPHASDPDEEVVLRVSAVAGLSDLVPGLEVSGSSAAAIDLVYDDLDPHIESTRIDGPRLVLTRRSRERYSAVQLAAALRGKELRSARAVDQTTIEANFADERTAALVQQYQALGFDLGPFQFEAQDENGIRLERRGGEGVDVIEIIGSTRSDEWRMLLAHELDVIPFAASTYRAQFAGVQSVRLLDIPAKSTATLYFNVRSPSLSAAAVRRRIAGEIRREAVARIACGDPACAAPAVPAGSSSLPARLTLLVPQDDSALRTAAKILRHELWNAGIELTVSPAPVTEIVQRMSAGDFELSLLPLTLAQHGYGFFLSPNHPKALPMTGFADPAYDAAVDRGDLKTAQAILDREVPITRLFEMRSFAAIDARFCGDVTPSESSLRWLSELYPCEDGPPP